jgi:hypothetical protein
LNHTPPEYKAAAASLPVILSWMIVFMLSCDLVWCSRVIYVVLFRNWWTICARITQG